MALKNHEAVEELVRFFLSKPFRFPFFITFTKRGLQGLVTFLWTEHNKPDNYVIYYINNIIRNFVILFCSFFARYELPSLQVDKVSELMIIVVHTKGPNWWETVRMWAGKIDSHKNSRYASFNWGVTSRFSYHLQCLLGWFAKFLSLTAIALQVRVLCFLGP